eukprot:4119761-Pyramimonas_sp.AAC.1
MCPERSLSYEGGGDDPQSSVRWASTGFQALTASGRPWESRRKLGQTAAMHGNMRLVPGGWAGGTGGWPT